MKNQAFASLTDFDSIRDTCTRHALKRMNHRGVRADSITAAIHYGRIIYRRNAVYHVVGRKEVARYRKQGVDLSATQGIHVVCDSRSHTVLTVYRNQSLNV